MSQYAEDEPDIVGLLQKASEDMHPYLQWWYGRTLRRAIKEIEELRTKVNELS